MLKFTNTTMAVAAVAATATTIATTTTTTITTAAITSTTAAAAATLVTVVDFGKNLLLRYWFYVRFVGYNLKVSRQCHVGNGWLNGNISSIICRNVYTFIQNVTFLANSPLVISVKPEAKWKFCTAAMLLFHILMKNFLNKVVYFWKIYYHTSFDNLTVNGANVTPPPDKLLHLTFCYYWLQEWYNSHKIFT